MTPDILCLYVTPGRKSVSQGQSELQLPLITVVPLVFRDLEHDGAAACTERQGSVEGGTAARETFHQSVIAGIFLLCH